MHSFAVIVTEGNAFSVVPTKWLCGSDVLWPPKVTTKMIMDHAEPDHTYAKYPCQIVEKDMGIVKKN